MLNALAPQGGTTAFAGRTNHTAHGARRPRTGAYAICGRRRSRCAACTASNALRACFCDTINNLNPFDIVKPSHDMEAASSSFDPKKNPCRCDTMMGRMCKADRHICGCRVEPQKCRRPPLAPHMCVCLTHPGCMAKRHVCACAEGRCLRPVSHLCVCDIWGSAQCKVTRGHHCSCKQNRDSCKGAKPHKCSCTGDPRDMSRCKAGEWNHECPCKGKGIICGANESRRCICKEGIPSNCHAEDGPYRCVCNRPDCPECYPYDKSWVRQRYGVHHCTCSHSVKECRKEMHHCICPNTDSTGHGCVADRHICCCHLRVGPAGCIALGGHKCACERSPSVPCRGMIHDCSCMIFGRHRCLSETHECICDRATPKTLGVTVCRSPNFHKCICKHYPLQCKAAVVRHKCICGKSGCSSPCRSIQHSCICPNPLCISSDHFTPRPQQRRAGTLV